MIAGLDEAGAGSIAFDLVASAVVLPDNFDVTHLKDSKKMTAKARQTMCDKIMSGALACGVGKVSPSEIDMYGMAWARRAVFHRAIEKMNYKVDKFIVDGTIFEPYDDTAFECIPKADASISVVSAASIVAKHTHDSDVKEYCAMHAGEAARYGWLSNKGYGSTQHVESIKQFGRIPNIHRYSFKLKAFE